MTASKRLRKRNSTHPASAAPGHCGVHSSRLLVVHNPPPGNQQRLGGWSLRGGWQWLRTAPDPATGRGRAELVCHCTPFRCTTQTKQAHHGGVGPERSDSRVVPCFCTTWLPFRVPPGLAEARFRCSNGGTSCAPSTQQPELLHSPRLLVLDHNPWLGHNQSRWVGGP